MVSICVQCDSVRKEYWDLTSIGACMHSMLAIDDYNVPWRQPWPSSQETSGLIDA